MADQENGMDQDRNNEQEEDRSEHFFSPGGESSTQETSSQSQPSAAPAQATQPTAKAVRKKQNNDKKSICLVCGKDCTSGAIQCTICSMWCHMTCTKLSKEALKGLEIQAKEVGQAYWACRSCMSFNNKWNAHMKETSRRQDETDSRVEDNSKNIEELRRLVEATRKDLRAQAKETDGLADRMERLMEEELRERESRRLNLVMHGVPEPGPETTNARDRMEVDKSECEMIFGGMKARTRKHHIRFCRRVGEKKDDPRPMVIGLYSEEERRHILERSRELKNTRFACVTIVPDMTKQQRKGEMRLREEAERRNHELSGEDSERNLKWIVVGSRGEKRLIKSTEREEYSGGGGGNGYGTGGRGGLGGGGMINGGDRGGRESDRSTTQSGDTVVAVSAIPQINSYSNINSNRTNPTYNYTNRHTTGARTSSNFNNGSNGGGGNNYGSGGGFNGSASNSGYNSTNSGPNYNSGQGSHNSGNRGYSNYGGNTYGGNTYRDNYNGGNGNNYHGGRGGSNNGYNEPYGPNRGGSGGNALTRPRQETGAISKEGRNQAENYQERDQDGLVRTDAQEEVEWGTGNLPEPIGNKRRERLGSKRLRSWEEEEEERNLRKQRS